MSTIFVNGGSPDYLGFSFFNSLELLSHLKDQMLLAGWTLITDLIASQSKMVLKAISGVNAHPCWLIFEVVDDPNVITGKRLNLQGDLSGLGISLSPIVYTTFIDGNEGKLWAAITESNIGLCTVGTNNDYRGIHGGFCDRVDPINDANAWYIGYISSKIWENWVAKSAANSTPWHQLNSDLGNGTLLDSNPAHQVGGITGTIDRYTVETGKEHKSRTTTATTNMNQNTYYKCEWGQVNRYGGSCISGDYYLPEGQGSLTGFGFNPGSSLFTKNMYFRGVIPNIRVGFSSRLGGMKYFIGDEVILSTGYPYFQGLRIK